MIPNTLRRCLALTALCALVAAPASAQRKPAKIDPVAEVAPGLDAAAPAEVEAAIQGLGLIGTEDAMKAVAARIERGLPRDLLLTAMFTIGAMGHPGAAPVLAKLAQHRAPDVRVRAIEMLGALGVTDVAPTLITALGDTQLEVRAAAATALGDLGASQALEALFRAQDRGVTEASQAIGKIVRGPDVPRVLESVGRTPLHTLAPALRTIIGRADIEESARLQVVARISELATPEVKSFLREVLDDSRAKLTDRLRTALMAAAQQIAD